MGVPAKHDSGLDFDERSILHEEVDRLPELERLAVVLCDLEGRTYEQAAGQLGWTAPPSITGWPPAASGCVTA